MTDIPYISVNDVSLRGCGQVIYGEIKFSLLAGTAPRGVASVTLHDIGVAFERALAAIIEERSKT